METAIQLKCSCKPKQEFCCRQTQEKMSKHNCLQHQDNLLPMRPSYLQHRDRSCCVTADHLYHLNFIKRDCFFRHRALTSHTGVFSEQPTRTAWCSSSAGPSWAYHCHLHLCSHVLQSDKHLSIFCFNFTCSSPPEHIFSGFHITTMTNRAEHKLNTEF